MGVRHNQKCCFSKPASQSVFVELEITGKEELFTVGEYKSGVAQTETGD